MKFINLTPHPVTVANGNIRITFEKDPKVIPARVDDNFVTKLVECELAPGVVVSFPTEVRDGFTVSGLPEPMEGVMYIVSSMVASRVRRPDVVAPLTDSTCERDEQGNIISVKGFHTYSEDFKQKHKTYAAASPRRATVRAVGDNVLV